MLLSPEEFARNWGTDLLIRLPAGLATAPIPKDSREFLVRAGLPAFIRYFPGSTDGVISFCRLGSGLAPVLEEETVGPPLPSEWSVYWIMGDEFFCNGAAWWCVHGPTGRVDRIDIEIDPPIEFVNSSAAHLASALLAASLWSERSSHSSTDWPSGVDRFKRELAELDPPCLQSDRYFWPVYLDFIRSEGPHLSAFEKGPREEGEQALRDGPW
ncbi:MAG TPA: SUKH-4 family immunity protein [Gemmataceae bacterium]|nr:SUKH-4 family immunity protein [Gemmataceae bacterium]